MYPKTWLTLKPVVRVSGGAFCPVPFIIPQWEVEEECRCRERSSFLDKVGHMGFKEEVTFAL